MFLRRPKIAGGGARRALTIFLNMGRSKKDALSGRFWGSERRVSTQHSTWRRHTQRPQRRLDSGLLLAEAAQQLPALHGGEEEAIGHGPQDVALRSRQQGRLEA